MNKSYSAASGTTAFGKKVHWYDTVREDGKLVHAAPVCSPGTNALKVGLHLTASGFGSVTCERCKRR